MSTQVLGDVELVTKQELEAALDAVVVPEDDINSKIEAAGVVLEQAIAAAKAEVHSEVELANAALAQETANRTVKDAELTDMIHDEAQLRETTDDALRSRIEREEGVREAAEAEITQLVSQETEARKDAEAEITQLVSQETEARKEADAEITQLVSQETEARKEADAEITQLVSQETEARKEADAEVEKAVLEKVMITEATVFEDSVFCGRMTNLPIAQATIEVQDSSIAVGDIIATVGPRYVPAIPVSCNFVAELADGDYYIAARLDSTGNVFVVNKTKLEGTFEGNVNSVTVMYLTKE